MLSIQPLKSASGATSYYLNVINYYTNDSNSIRWLGEGSQVLQIYGKTVEQGLMHDLLSGKLPDGTQLGKISQKGIEHRPGFDMSVSAPKSFSVLLESGADPRLAVALDKTVEWFVKEMEHEFAQARMMINGKMEYIDTKNFVIAAFRQPNSRANDPQSHVHLVTMNMTQCPDGQWRSLASDIHAEKGVVEQIMKFHIYGGLKFRNKLANETKPLGYEIETTGDGLWEIKGVPKDILKNYSKRRNGIEEYMEENGMQGAAAASIATQRTKTNKEIVDFDAWKKDILSTCKTMGFDALQFVADTMKPKNMFARAKEALLEKFFDPEKQQERRGEKAVYTAIEAISEREAVFSPRQLKELALKHVIASAWVVDESYIDQAIEKKVQEQELYRATHPVTQKTMMTTPWQLSLESETIARIERGKSDITPICSKSTVQSFIKQKEAELAFQLSPSQKNAMIGFLTTKDRYMAIQGYAGTGKTTMLKLTRELSEMHGYQLRGITAGSSAAQELQSKGGLNAVTFARELLSLQKNNQDLKKVIFVVDEASMLSNPQGHKIVQLIENTGGQLKIIGDRAQLPSPASGRFFSLMQDYGIDTVAMTDNLRQKEGLLKESVQHAGRGEIYDAVEKLSDVKCLSTYQERITETANLWLNLSPNEREQTLCFAPTHKNRADITAIIRHKLKDEGVLTGETFSHAVLKERRLSSVELRESIYYAKNDALRFNVHLERYNIKPGEYLSVKDVSFKHKKNNTLSLLRENGRTITLPLSALPAFQTDKKGLERPIEVYQRSTLELMAGDQIQWKRNAQAQGINNSEIAKIQSITHDKMTLQNQDNKTISLSLNAPELKHLDHGYVLTTYAVQGKDKKRGIGFIESLNKFSATIQNFYVEISRAVKEMLVVTDNKDSLIKAITTHDSQKESALEFVDSAMLKQHAKQHNNPELSLESVIEKKQHRESEWQALEQKITVYVDAKQNQNWRQATIHAAQIVNNPVCYRLAQTRLSYGYQTFQRDALKLETAKLSKNISTAERPYFNNVKNYVRLSTEFANDVRRTLENRPVKNDKAMNQKSLQEKSAQLYQLAATISQNPEAHQPWLKHFSIGEANRLGIPQHRIREENAKAYTRLEKLTQRAEIFHERIERSQRFDCIPLETSKKQITTYQVQHDAKIINQNLMSKPEETYRAIWGEPKSINTREMRYSNGLIITLTGKNQGLWYDFHEGRGGSPIDALMESRKIDFKEALKLAGQLAGETVCLDKRQRFTENKPEQETAQTKQNSMVSARSIWEGGQVIKGTLAEIYLKKHRGIANIENLDVRFWPKGSTWISYDNEGKPETKINKIPALIIPAKNAKNEITGVQRIYLDEKTGTKNRFLETPKLSKGIIEGSAAIMQRGMKGSAIYIAEGPETAASIASVLPSATVIASLGVSNIKNLGSIITKLKGSEVIVAADFDGKQSPTLNITEKAIEALRQDGIKAQMIIPKPIEGLKKTDWNDVLVQKGAEHLKMQLMRLELKDAGINTTSDSPSITPQQSQTSTQERVQEKEILTSQQIASSQKNRTRALEMEI